jgi:hypothetical protein
MYKDPCSFSNPDFFLIKHISLLWNVDFSKQTLSGTCSLSLELQGGLATPNDSIVI